MENKNFYTFATINRLVPISISYYLNIMDNNIEKYKVYRYISYVSASPRFIYTLENIKRIKITDFQVFVIVDTKFHMITCT